MNYYTGKKGCIGTPMTIEYAKKNKSQLFTKKEWNEIQKAVWSENKKNNKDYHKISIYLSNEDYKKLIKKTNGKNAKRQIYKIVKDFINGEDAKLVKKGFVNLLIDKAMEENNIELISWLQELGGC